MTMRSPLAFMATMPSVVTGLGASAMRHQHVELGQLALPEVAMRQLGMRQGQIGLGDYPIAVADDVEIEGAGTPTHRRGAVAAACRFDRQEVAEQSRRPQRRLAPRHLIEIGGL